MGQAASSLKSIEEIECQVRRECRGEFLRKQAALKEQHERHKRVCACIQALDVLPRYVQEDIMNLAEVQKKRSTKGRSRVSEVDARLVQAATCLAERRKRRWM